MKKILFIGEENNDEENLRQLLLLSNYRVVFTGDGFEGIGLAFGERPDLILCDAQPRSIDGYRVIQALQESPETRGIPVVLLNSNEEDHSFRKAMEAGADDLLARPFEGIDLLRAVEACLERRQHRLSREHRSPDPKSPGAGNPAFGGDWRPDPGEMQEHRKKTILYLEGQRASQLWYVVSGKVKTYLIHSDGKELITNICGPGDGVGCAAAVQGGAYTDNAQVLEDAVLVVITRPEFQRLLAGDAAFVQQMIRWLGRSTRTQESALVDLAYSSLRKKVAHGILNLYDVCGRSADDKSYISVSRDNLAAIVASAPESLTRTLSDFRRERLIDVSDGRIYLLDEYRLRNMIS